MSIIDSLKRILGSDSREVPIIDSSDIPRFPRDRWQPIDPNELHTLATSTLGEIKRRREALPEASEIEAARTERAELQARLAGALHPSERETMQARADALGRAVDVYGVVLTRLDQVEAEAQSAQQQAENWLTVDARIKATEKASAEATKRRIAADALFAQYEDARAKTRAMIGRFNAERGPIAAKRDDLLAAKALGVTIDEGELAAVREHLQRLDRMREEATSVLAVLDHKAAEAEASAEAAARDESDAESNLQRLANVRQERDVRLATVEAARVICERLPEAPRARAQVLARLAEELQRHA